MMFYFSFAVLSSDNYDQSEHGPLGFNSARSGLWQLLEVLCSCEKFAQLILFGSVGYTRSDMMFV